MLAYLQGTMNHLSTLTSRDSATAILAEIDRRLTRAQTSLSGLARHREVRRLARARGYLTSSPSYLIVDAFLPTLLFVAGLVVIHQAWSGSGRDLHTLAGRVSLLTSALCFGLLMAWSARQSAVAAVRELAAALRPAVEN